MTTAYKTIQAMYTAINHRDLAGAMALVDEHCIYEDLNFRRTFTGKAAVKTLFEDALSSVPKDFCFIIDDITTGDDHAVGLIWHVELNGVPFPNTRGSSFYRISPTSGKLIFARDSVESPIKPGKVAFALIRAVTPLARWLLKPAPNRQRTGGQESD